MPEEGSPFSTVENSDNDRLSSLAAVASILRYVSRARYVSVLEVNLSLRDVTLMLLLRYKRPTAGEVHIKRVYHLDDLPAPWSGATCCDYLNETADDLVTFPIEALASPGGVYTLHIPGDCDRSSVASGNK